MYKNSRKKTVKTSRRNNTDRYSRGEVKTTRRAKESIQTEEKTTKRTKSSIQKKDKTRKLNKSTRRKANNDFVYYLIGGAFTVIVFIFAAYLFSSPSTPRQSKNKTPSYTIQDAKKLIVEGKSYIVNRNFREAEKVLKKSVEILNELKDYYQNDPAKSQEVTSFLDEANQNYYQAYKNSTIK